MKVKEQFKLQDKLLELKDSSKELTPREISFLITLVNHSAINKNFLSDIF